jgi:hypothetical protein
MKSLSSMAMVALAAAFTAGAMQTAAADCTGPFATCAANVNAVCTLDPDGVQRMTYMDDGMGSTMIFQRCVGGIYTARGYPNPYDAGAPAGNPDLPFPRTTLNYSTNNP